VLDEIRGYIGGVAGVDIRRRRRAARAGVRCTRCVRLHRRRRDAIRPGAAIDRPDELRESTINAATPLVVLQRRAGAARRVRRPSAHATRCPRGAFARADARPDDDAAAPGLAELPERQRNILNDIYLSNKPLEAGAC
jgi:hypothetical protein